MPREQPFSNDWEVARAVLLPHHETNQGESPAGEWILTAFLDRKGEILEENSEGRSMGIYPSRKVAEQEIARYLSERGVRKIAFEYMAIADDNWSDIKDLLNSPYGGMAWTIFARSKSDDDVRKYIRNVRKSLGAAGGSF